MTDTVVLKRVAPAFVWIPRVFRKLTPAAAWGAAGTMILAGVGFYNAMLNARMQTEDLKEAIKTMQSDRREVLDRLVRIEQSEKDIKDEQDRQREWRERIEYVAERDRIPRRRR